MVELFGQSQNIAYKTSKTVIVDMAKKKIQLKQIYPVLKNLLSDIGHTIRETKY